MKTKLFKIYSICIILLVNEVQPLSIPILSNIMDVVSLVTDISDIVTGRHDLTSGNLFKTKVDPTLAKVNELSEQVNELTQTLNIKMDKLMTAVLTNVPRSIQFTNLMRKLIGYVTRIDELFDDYQYYVNEDGNFTEYTVEDFSKVTTSHKFGDIQDILRQMYHLFIPGQLDQRDESLLDVMVATLTDVEESERCNMLKTPQQQVYDLYETVILTEIKGFIMASYAYGLLSIHHNVSFSNEVEKLLSQTVLRCSQYLSAIAQPLQMLPRIIFLCDPPQHVKGETHVEFNGIRLVLTHNTIAYPIDNCENKCQYIDDSTYYGDFYYKGDMGKSYWFPNHQCHGQMYDCLDIETTTFCELPKTAENRYSWVENSYGTFGSKDNCDEGNIHYLFAWKKNGYWCTTCYCECSEKFKESTAVRAFSMRPQIADIENNMVVTGIRFELKDNMIHVQIEEGKLLPAGQIEKNSNHLVELEDFKYLDNVDGGGFVKIDGDKEQEMTLGEDFSFIYRGQRDINLDNVYSQEPGYVVTGAKMSRDPKNKNSIQLDIHVTPCNLTTGMLTPTDDKPSKWIDYQVMPDHDRKPSERKEIELLNRKQGSRFYDNLPASEDFSVIWFVADDLKEEMGLQSIPFLDRQIAAPYPRVPLDGISLFYRGREKSGGFIGFKLNTADISQYLNPTLTPENVERLKNNYENKIINHAVEIE